MLQQSILGRVLSRIHDLANEVLEAEINHSEYWRPIDGLIHSDKFENQVELWRRVETEVKRTLSRLNIEPEFFEYDVTDTLSATVCLVELWRLFQTAERDADYYGGGDGGWFWIIEDGLPDIDRFSTAWAYRRAEARKRAATAKQGAEAKAKSQRAIIADAIQRFDPGDESGLSNSRRAEMILSRAHAAKAKGEFTEADRLPSADRLRRYLGSTP